MQQKKMRDTQRIPRVLRKFEHAWSFCPELRFGQLIFNICSQFDPKWKPEQGYNLEDDIFEKALDLWLTKNTASGGWKS